MFFTYLIIEQKENSEILKNYAMRLETVQYNFNRLYIENEENMIRLDIEEQSEEYVSVLFERKPSKEYFYALSDYSYIKGARDVFDVININKDSFYKELRMYYRKSKLPWKHKSCKIKIVQAVYSLIEEYIKYFTL